MKYKVEVSIIKDWNLDDEITQEEYEWLIGRGCPKSWFQPVEEEVEIGDYWKLENVSTNEGVVYRIYKRIKGRAVAGQTNEIYREQNFSSKWLKEHARKLTTSEITSALTNEAKRRGLVKGAHFKHNEKHHDCIAHNKYKITSNEFEYIERNDTLVVDNWEAYNQGDWAEIIEPTIEINGKQIEVKDGTVTIECGDTIEEDMFKNFYAVVNKYDLNVSRNGEKINEQLQQIWDEMPNRLAGTYFEGTITDVTFTSSDLWGNDE